MAIKITGTTVINDSRGLENITDIDQIIRAPKILTPTDNETDTEFESLTIEGGVYNAILSNNRDYREFQVDLATGDFSSPVVSEQVNSDSLTLSTVLSDSTEHKVRIRDVDLDGIEGPFSDVVNFTTRLGFETLGEAGGGGFYLGTIGVSGTCYYLIVAPNATGCVGNCQWKTSNTDTSGTGSDDDGYENTYSNLENSTHPAGNWTATRTINGFSDWYLPSLDELVLFYNYAGNGSGNPLPGGEGFATGEYWSSTDYFDECARAVNFFFGFCRIYQKTEVNDVRAIRRVPI